MTVIAILCGALWALVVIAGVISTRRERQMASLTDDEMFDAWQGRP